MYSDFDRLLSFVSVHHAIRAEKLLAGAGIRSEAMPTPREIAISCGQCLLFKAADQEQVLDILRSAQVQWSKLFRRDSGTRVYEQLTDYNEHG